MRRSLGVLFLAATAALAQDRTDDIFRVWDTNADGVLTRDEIPDAAIFSRVDTDKDGKVTREEVARFLGMEPKPEPPAKKKEEAPMPRKAPRTIKERVDDFFFRFDKNRDGRIVKGEFAGGDAVFEKYDRGRNGSLGRREVQRYVEDVVTEAKRNPRWDTFMDLFDLNRDGKVTRREYDGPQAFFRRYDRDRDRIVTEAELRMESDGNRMMYGADEAPDGPTPLPKRGLLERYDKDGDGRITLEELNGAESVLHRLDRNGDGVLSGSEAR